VIEYLLKELDMPKSALAGILGLTERSMTLGNPRVKRLYIYVKSGKEAGLQRFQIMNILTEPLDGQYGATILSDIRRTK